jgi:Flp pilus assembly protein TadD
MRKGPLALLLSSVFILSSLGFAQNLRITLPKRSKPTPVQQLNRDGVKAIQHRDYGKAKKLFYKAYLIDPNDPFTLNNLGYVSELEGDLDRAQRYYGLSAEISSDAVVDRASSDSAEGKPVSEIAGNAQDRNLEVNRLNVQAMGLLMKDRAPEADLILQKALQVDSRNPFTLNNIGFAKEKEGELDKALSYYTAAAASGSSERIVVTTNSDWRGKPISEIAGRNAKKVRQQIADLRSDVEKQVALLNLRGVSALNRNEREQARSFFEQAYKLDPKNGFALNNMGYVAELEGDRETAEFYYAKARDAEHANSTVRIATRKDAEGQQLGAVAQTSDAKVQAAMEAAVEAKRREGGPVELHRRDNTPVTPLELPASDTTPVEPNADQAQPQAEPNTGQAQPNADQPQNPQSQPSNQVAPLRPRPQTEGQPKPQPQQPHQ